MLSMSSLIILLFCFIYQCLLCSSISADSNKVPTTLIENIDPHKLFSSIFDKYFNNSFNQKEVVTTTKVQTLANNDTDVVFFIPTPPMVGQKPDLINIDEPIYTNKGPQPFTILMNFQNDGTTSLQILNQNNIYWSDIGNCRHGQIFDPNIGICRDVFCVQGFVFGPNGCVADANYNSTEYTEPVKKPSPEMNVQITLMHKLCTYDLNSSAFCNHTLIMKPTQYLHNGLFNSFAKILKTDSKRLENFTFISHEIHNETIISFNNNKRKRNINGFELDENEINSFKKEDSMDKDLNRGFTVSIESTEILKLSFTIKDMKLFENENKETIILFYYLNALALDRKYFNINQHKCVITEVVELKESKEEGWCNSAGDEKLSYRDNFRIFASFGDQNKPKYYVYVNETLYGTGYYYLTVLYAKKPDSFTESTSTHKPLNFDKEDTLLHDRSFIDSVSDEDNFSDKREIKSHVSLNYLSDVTNIVFDQNSNNIVSSKILWVCNRTPKIRVKCETFEVIRVRLCELQLMKDRSYCSLAMKKCFLIDEYEYDLIEPENYIRVCKSNTSDLKPLNYLSLNFKTDINKTISGWVSFLSTVISLIFMFFTLFTYFMFKKIRNLPGWNIINLTLALSIGQFCYLLGSFLNTIPLACFIISVITHYGFLSSFFWMNVIAFDLYRNFCDKSSLVLIQTIRLKERLPKYSLYAWIVPFLIVISGVIVDFSVKSSTTPYRPCYSGYFKGCNLHSENYHLSNIKTNFSRKNFGNETENFCYADNTINPTVLIVNGPCWIQNGKANLIYFGLPIGIIIFINAVFYFLTIYNIRKKKQEQKDKLRRISKISLPGDEDVKFYIQMAFIMGFTWIIGFFLTTTSSKSDTSFSIEIIYNVLTYLFILLNASTGVFIFFAFLFRKDVKNLYKKSLSKFSFFSVSMKKTPVSYIGRKNEKTKPRIRENSSSSTAIFEISSNSSSNTRNKNSISSSSSSTTEQLNELAKSNIIFESQEDQNDKINDFKNTRIYI